MSTNTDALEFLQEMVRQLDATIRELAQRELELVTDRGPDRVEALRELWNETLDRQDELELGRGLDWHDRELIWVWARLQRAHSKRATVGKSLMRNITPRPSMPGQKDPT